jgi:predicted protein tyrosine phosphatase
MSLIRNLTIKNEYQGKYKKVLCVCSAGVLRSPTAAVILSGEPWNYNTRAVGLDDYVALVPVSDTLLEWADEIVCMDDYQEAKIKEMTGKPIIRLDIPDNYAYRDEELISLIKERYERARIAHEA